MTRAKRLITIAIPTLVCAASLGCIVENQQGPDSDKVTTPESADAIDTAEDSSQLHGELNDALAAVNLQNCAQHWLENGGRGGEKTIDIHWVAHEGFLYVDDVVAQVPSAGVDGEYEECLASALRGFAVDLPASLKEPTLRLPYTIRAGCAAADDPDREQLPQLSGGGVGTEASNCVGWRVVGGRCYCWSSGYVCSCFSSGGNCYASGACYSFGCGT